MKTIWSILLSFFLFVVPVAASYSVQGSFDIALRQGNVTELFKYVGGNMSINMGTYPVTYSKAQAERVLKDFFDKNPPVSFEIKHVGSGSNKTKFEIGILETSNATYRVYISAKELDNSVVIIQEIKFVKI